MVGQVTAPPNMECIDMGHNNRTEGNGGEAEWLGEVVSAVLARMEKGLRFTSSNPMLRHGIAAGHLVVDESPCSPIEAWAHGRHEDELDIVGGWAESLEDGFYGRSGNGQAWRCGIGIAARVMAAGLMAGYERSPLLSEICNSVFAWLGKGELLTDEPTSLTSPFIWDGACEQTPTPLECWMRKQPTIGLLELIGQSRRDIADMERGFATRYPHVLHTDAWMVGLGMRCMAQDLGLLI